MLLVPPRSSVEIDSPRHIAGEFRVPTRRRPYRHRSGDDATDDFASRHICRRCVLVVTTSIRSQPTFTLTEVPPCLAARSRSCVQASLGKNRIVFRWRRRARRRLVLIAATRRRRQVTRRIRVTSLLAVVARRVGSKRPFPIGCLLVAVTIQVRKLTLEPVIDLRFL